MKINIFERVLLVSAILIAINVLPIVYSGPPLRGKYDQRAGAGGTNLLPGDFYIHGKMSAPLPGEDKNLFGYVAGEASINPNLVLYDYLGLRRTSVQLTMDRAMAFTVRSDYKIILGNDIATLKRQLWTISYAAYPAQYAISKTSDSNTDPTAGATRADHDPNSNYVFFSTVQKYDRLDTSTMTLSASTTYTASTSSYACSTCSRIVDLWVDSLKSYFVIFPIDTPMAVVDRTSLTATRVFNNKNAGGAVFVKTEASCLDNLGSGTFFIFVKDYLSTDYHHLAQLDLTISTTTQLPVSSSITPGYYETSVAPTSLLNIGTLSYMLFITPSYSFGYIIIYSKSPLAYVTNTFSPALTNLGYGIHKCSLAGIQPVLERSYFTVRSTTSTNINSHFLVYDKCTYRDGGTDVCITCATGLVRSSLSANNYCMSPFFITPGNGIDLTTNSVKPCAPANCLACKADYTKCTECSTSPQTYLYNDVCNATPDPDASTDPILTEAAVCVVLNCLSCPVDSSVCTACNTAASPPYYLSGSNCVLLSSVTGAFGATANGTIAACTVSGCTACLNDNTICTACTPGSTWLITNQCLAPASFPAGTGVTSPTATGPCTSAGCQTCSASASTCTVCNTGGGYYLYSGACYTTATMPNGYGLSGTTVVGCQSTGCTRCAANYAVCTACNTGSNYYLSGTSCILVTSIPAGSGANTAAGTVETCQTLNCANCQANYLTCTACNTAANYYLSGTSCILVTSIPSGSGANPATGTVMPCQVGCTNCQANYLTCTACNTGSGYYLFGSNCVTSPPSRLRHLWH
jgi:hypothetical protein